MNTILTLDEQKGILFAHIAPATGRPRELLEVLLDAFPNLLNEDQLKHRLRMSGRFALKSVLRNARIFIDLREHYDVCSERWYYGLDDRGIKMVTFHRLMSQLSC